MGLLDLFTSAGDSPDPTAGAYLVSVIVIAFVLVGYVMSTLDRVRPTSTSRDDTQVGLKLVLWGFALAGLMLGTSGVSTLVGFLLGGAKGGGDLIKGMLPPLIVGPLVFFGVERKLLPRTNTTTHRQVERYALGAAAAMAGAAAITGLDLFLTSLFTNTSWATTARHLATTGVAGAVGFIAITRFGAIAGWTAAPPPPPSPSYPTNVMPPPPGGGYGPPPGQQGPGGSLPPLGGGYAPPPSGNPYELR